MGPELWRDAGHKQPNLELKCTLKLLIRLISQRPFRVSSSDRTVHAETVIIATGAKQKRMGHPRLQGWRILATWCIGLCRL